MDFQRELCVSLQKNFIFAEISQGEQIWGQILEFLKLTENQPYEVSMTLFGFEETYLKINEHSGLCYELLARKPG